MNLLVDSVGAIIDLKEQRNWSSKELAAEVARRSRILHQNGVYERSVVALIHGGTAHLS
jgi:ribosome-binding protein aMBF1 (putative translation factor)